MDFKGSTINKTIGSRPDREVSRQLHLTHASMLTITFDFFSWSSHLPLCKVRSFKICTLMELGSARPNSALIQKYWRRKCSEARR